MNQTNCTESPIHENNSITASHKNRKHYSVMVSMSDSLASNLGSIHGQIYTFL